MIRPLLLKTHRLTLSSLRTATTMSAPLASPFRTFPISRSELSLPAVLKCGQAFRWTERKLQLEAVAVETKMEGTSDGVVKQEVKEVVLESEVSEWSMGWEDRTIVLRQDDAGVHYRSLFPNTPSGHSSHSLDLSSNTTLPILRTYFALDHAPLLDLYAEWSAKDPKFAKIMESGQGEKVRGLRVCKQDEWEALVAFICSSNNNIPRITLMLSRLCQHFGHPLPSPPPGFTLPTPPTASASTSTLPAAYSFPTPEALSGDEVEPKLRELGFGYRAGYVASTARMLCSIAQHATTLGRWPTSDELDEAETSSSVKAKSSQKFEPKGYLRHLAAQPYDEAHAALTRFAGVGPKVADCVALFGLGVKDVVPVDVHVFQIAQKTYRLSGLPSSGAPSKAHYAKIQSFFKELWGPWAGWAQQVVFAADLREFQVEKVKKEKSEEGGEVKVKKEEVVTPRGERSLKRSQSRFVDASPSTPSAPPTSPSDTFTPPTKKRRKVVAAVVKKVEEVGPVDGPTLGTVPLEESTVDGKRAGTVDVVGGGKNAGRATQRR